MYRLYSFQLNCHTLLMRIASERHNKKDKFKRKLIPRDKWMIMANGQQNAIKARNNEYLYGVVFINSVFCILLAFCWMWELRQARTHGNRMWNLKERHGWSFERERKEVRRAHDHCSSRSRRRQWRLIWCCVRTHNRGHPPQSVQPSERRSCTLRSLCLCIDFSKQAPPHQSTAFLHHHLHWHRRKHRCDTARRDLLVSNVSTNSVFPTQLSMSSLCTHVGKVGSSFK